MIRQGFAVRQGIACSFGEADINWFRAMTDSEEEAQMRHALAELAAKQEQ